MQLLLTFLLLKSISLSKTFLVRADGPHRKRQGIKIPRKLDLAEWEYSYSCPSEPGGSITISAPAEKEILIEKSITGNMCTLTLVTKGKIQTSAPVGRSYDGYDWERVAGPFSSLQYTCDVGASHCKVVLPSIMSSSQEYHLTTQDFPSERTTRDEIARFFEQTTFGTTSDDLDDFTLNLNQFADANLTLAFTEWVRAQISDVSPTSHRAYYRKLVSSAYFWPGREGPQRSPCDVGSRWRWYSFTKHDIGRSLRINKADDFFVLSVEGQARTKVKQLAFHGDTKFSWTKANPYIICSVKEDLSDSWFGILYDGNCEHFEVGNPPVNINGISPAPKYVFNLDITYEWTFVAKRDPDDKIVTMVRGKGISDNACSSLPNPLNQNVYAKLSNGQTVIYEPTIKLQQNEEKSPIDDGGGQVVSSTNNFAQCANAPRTFLNENNCKLSAQESSCSPYGSITGTIILNAENIRKFYELLERPVYAVVDLRLSDDTMVQNPCTAGQASRWKAVDSCEENVMPLTSNLFGSLIINSKDANAKFRDIILEDDGLCHENDVDKRALYVKIEDQCWANIHPDNFSVYDFKQWANRHPGNTNAMNYIEKPGKEGNHKINYPSSHPLTRWNTNKSTLKYIGKLGDRLSIEDIPIWELRDRKVAEAFGFYLPRPEGKNIVVCGSPNEVANSALSVPRLSLTQGPGFDSLDDLQFPQQKKTVWTMIALKAEDQLRQRMAWALSQLLVISPSALIPTNTETFLAYYDIMVRNAFGSYRNILREIAYSPMMASMLTYYESKSSEHIWIKEGSVQYADENFAREIMQLFTIGLVALNMDGTMKTDAEGKPINTYTNDDIAEYARAWTGFSQQGPRGNVEERERGNNSIDPMKIRISWRDHYPKMGLDGKYVGDGVPLCSDLPNDIFLRKGAKWKLLGKSTNSDDQDFFRLNQDKDNVATTILDQSSFLLKKLCKRRSGKCTYPAVVNINYNLSCVGIECTANSIKIVEVESGVFYEFVRPPCVVFPFFTSGKKVSRSRDDSFLDTVCVDRNLAIAAEACCDRSLVAIHNTCKYTGETVPFSLASSRCSNAGKDLCEYQSISWTDCGSCCNYSGFFWTDADCDVIVVVDEDGKVAVERPEDSGPSKSYDSATFFRVHWDNDDFPSHLNSCDNDLCEVYGSYCRCKIQVNEQRVFTVLPSRAEVLSGLTVGGLDPLSSDYAQTFNYGEVKVYVTAADFPNEYAMNTVFEVEDYFGRTLYLKNMKSMVTIGSVFSFRNPPTFFSATPEVRDAQYENEAAIDQYFYHENLAPFLALRFIQRFGISNPSPSFVQRVATAFKTGQCHQLPNDFSAQYGDLGATVATIILDRESRNILLDSDPAFGSLREPLLKTMALMRNFNFKQVDGELISLDHRLNEKIGQESHEMPSVFSFFLPEFAPPGEISMSSLVSPEAMLMPYSLGLINGMISMAKYGASRCHGGFSAAYCTPEIRKRKKKASGRLQYLPYIADEDVVNDIATLLTSGRMSESSRSIMTDIYLTQRNNTSKAQALQTAQQLAIASPEFHVAGKPSASKLLRQISTSQRKTCKRHKILVHVLLEGGNDSFNMLVPHSKCGGNNLNKQYRSSRGKVAIPKRELLTIDASNSSQQCEKFGLHPKLPYLQSLYNDNNALFFAGIGVLNNPVTKLDFMHKTRTQLFAHNTMQAEIGRLDPNGDSFGTGLLGRISDSLTSNSYNVNAFSIDTSLVALQGNDLDIVKSSVNSRTGFKHFNPSAPNSNLTKNMLLLNGGEREKNGIFSEFWSSSLHDNIKRNDQMYWAQRKSKLLNTFPETDLGRQLKLVSKLVQSNDCRGSDRDIFYVENGGWDHHSRLHYFQEFKFIELNDALNSFANELKSHDKWVDTTIVVTSDFGRTITPNSGKGTDHGWSGHSFILGGQVNGGRILGEYPTNLNRNGPLNVGRGRLIPAIPWESKWNGVAQWLGVQDLDYVLPNRNSFSEDLFEASDLYLDSEKSDSFCQDVGKLVSCIPGDIPEEMEDDDLVVKSDEVERPDDTEYSIDDDSKSDSQSSGDQERGPATTVTSIIVSLIAVTIIAVIYERRTGQISHCADMCLCFSKKLDMTMEMDSSDTDSQNASYEVDVVTLLHKKSGGVELANEEVQWDIGDI